jgi:hypothetical protein
VSAPLASPASYLRVYEPMAAFSPDEQRRWQALREKAGSPAPAATAVPSPSSVPGRLRIEQTERRMAVKSAVRGVLDIDDDLALLDVVDGLLLACPLRTRTRALVAAEEFRESLPPRVWQAFLSHSLATATISGLDALRGEQPDLKLHVLSCTYLVPLPWFVPFDPADRVLVTGLGERSSRCVTRMSAARRRVARSLLVLRKHFPQAPTVAGLEQLGRWLEEFHPHARLELDYAGLVALLTDNQLREDTSVADVAAAIAALDAGDTGAAGAAYERVTERWRGPHGLETAS